eukprot:gene13389-17953_t
MNEQINNCIDGRIEVSNRDILDLSSIVTIQKILRGYLYKKKVKKLKNFNYLQSRREKLSTIQGIHRKKFEEIGAIIKIQRWIRRFGFYKIIWRRKNAKYLLNLISKKKVIKAINHTYQFRNLKQSEIDNNPVLYKTILSVIYQRIVRGFLGRKRFKRLKIENIKLKQMQLITSIIIQKNIRKYLIRKKNIKIGYRFLLLKKKKQKYQQKLQFMALLEDVDTKYNLYNRRETFSFTNLRLGNINFLSVIAPINVLKIQCCWRRFKAMKRIKFLKFVRKIKLIKRIQSWYRTWKR